MEKLQKAIQLLKQAKDLITEVKTEYDKKLILCNSSENCGTSESQTLVDNIDQTEWAIQEIEYAIDDISNL